MITTSYYDTKDKETLTTYLLSRCAQISPDKCHVFKALCPSWSGTHSEEFQQFEQSIVNVKRKVWPKHHETKQTIHWDGPTALFAAIHTMDKTQCMAEISKNWITIAMMTVR